jgi:hypothetical protein
LSWTNRFVVPGIEHLAQHTNEPTANRFQQQQIDRGLSGRFDETDHD